MSLKRVYLKSSITSIHVNAAHLFVGFGNKLQIWNLDELNVIAEYTVFELCNIHNINTSFCEHSAATIVSVNGNRLLSVLKVNESGSIFSLSKERAAFNAQDWILETKIHNCKIFCTLAHNLVIVYDMHSGVVVSRIHCPVKCILYSALFVEVNCDSFILAAGTVFKEVIIWEFQREIINIDQRLTGHDGVIFSLYYNHSKRLLATASDDRSIRLYSHCVSNNEKSFCIDGQKGIFNFLTVFFGHESRIWKVVVLNNYLLSVGENSNMCLWDIERENVVYKERSYNDSSIWSLCVDKKHNRIFYGASDGCLRVRLIADLVCATMSVKNKPDNFALKSVGFVNDFKETENLNLMVTTDNGNVVVFAFQNDSLVEKFKIPLGEKFENYNIFALHSSEEYVLFAGKDGDILTYYFKQQSKNSFKAHSGKIFSLFFVTNDIYVTCGLSGQIKLWHNSKFLQSHTLPYCKYRWATCGALLSLNMLIIGDRSGSVTVFQNDTQKYYNGIHGCNGVTDLREKPKSDFLYSCGRNGKVFEYVYNLNEKTIHLLRTIHFGNSVDWIARLYFDIDSHSMYALGFLSTDFVVLSEEQQSTLWAVNCGGGHRSWDFRKHNEKFHFTFIKQKEVVWYSKKTNTLNSCLSVASNSSKINCASFLFRHKSNELYFSSAGEDNNVIIFKFTVSNKHLSKEMNLCAHISNVKTSASIDCSGFTLLVTGGGRSQLIIWKLWFINEKLVAQQLVNHFLWNLDGPNRKPWKDKFTPTPDPQTRYMSVAIDKYKDHIFLIGTACSDAYFRLFLLDSNKALLEIINVLNAGNFCGLSLKLCSNVYIYGSNDGFIRFWSLIEDNLNELSNRLSSIVVKETNSFVISNGLFPSSLLLSQLSFMNSHQQHQSSVNSLDCHYLKDDYWILCSGGDDASFACTLLKFSTDLITSFPSTVKSGSHCSSLTGVIILNTHLILTTSVDQKVILWKYTVDFNTLRINVEPMEMVSSCVADISGCTHIYSSDHEMLVLIFGEGFQLFKFNLCESNSMNATTVTSGTLISLENMKDEA